MSRQLELSSEERTSKRNKALIAALDHELENALQEEGVLLDGFSVRVQEWDCLMTLRGVKSDVGVVAFVGAEDVIGAITKAVRVARSKKLVWREDNYRAIGG